MERGFETFELGDITLQSGTVLPDAKLGYKTYGTLNATRTNVIVLPTFYTGTHEQNEGYLRSVSALDPKRYIIVSINLIGNGLSSSPSNTPPPFDGPRFPHVTLHDNIACQHRLLTEQLDVERIALVAGWSMAGCQSYQWATQYPDMVEAKMPFLCLRQDFTLQLCVPGGRKGGTAPIRVTLGPLRGDPRARPWVHDIPERMHNGATAGVISSSKLLLPHQAGVIVRDRFVTVIHEAVGRG